MDATDTKPEGEALTADKPKEAEKPKETKAPADLTGTVMTLSQRQERVEAEVESIKRKEAPEPPKAPAAPDAPAEKPSAFKRVAGFFAGGWDD